jgi:hypothetical protein
VSSMPLLGEEVEVEDEEETAPSPPPEHACKLPVRTCCKVEQGLGDTLRQ